MDGSEVKLLRIQLKTITPVLGGSSAPRTVDALDPIRAPSIRGHLRFWWRALHGHAWTSRELFKRERALWGGIGKEGGTRSQVEVWVEVDRTSAIQDSQNIQQDDPGAYALWIARAPKGQTAAPRWRAGLRFQLHLRVPSDHAPEVENAVRAWILWGGYGGRTRRGLGGLTVQDELSRWLPPTPSGNDLRTLFHGLPLLGRPLSEHAREVPLLHGARLIHGRSEARDAQAAWLSALKWLREFRQGQASSLMQDQASAGRFARECGNARRPGPSRWPEADKIRQLFPKPKGARYAHEPRAQYSTSRQVAWPRAGFGLPLAIRFQTKDRQGIRYQGWEPEDVELRWHDGKEVRERFASPLIVKAMPLADGRFVPIALWLRRAWPDNGQVVLMKKGVFVRDSKAPFERLLAPGDTALYAPLLKRADLEEAFLSWVMGFPGVKEAL